MSTASDDILKTLSALSATDRSWIIDKLSPQARSKLLQRAPSMKAEPAVERPPIAAANRPDPAVDHMYECLQRVEAAAIASLLKGEPVWVAAALLSAQQWPWYRAVLDLMPGSRAEIERVLDSGAGFTRSLQDAVVRIVSAKVAALAPTPEASRFEQLVAKVRSSRLNRRLAFSS